MQVLAAQKKSGKDQKNISLESNQKANDSDYRRIMTFGYAAPGTEKKNKNQTQGYKATQQSFTLDFNNISLFSSQTARIQPKLKINSPGDKYEQEADQMAEKVMRMPDNQLIQRKCAKCEEEEEEENNKIQMKGEASVPLVSPAFHLQLHHSKNAGQPLPAGTNQFMSKAFGSDFSRVRIHDNETAHQLNQNIHSKAFTFGENIYFKKGQFTPGSNEGKKLLAHELTHVVQQNRGLTAEVAQRSVDEDEIDGTNPRFSFSTRCGWIDWSHANAGMTSQIIPAITQVSDNMRSSGTTDPQPVTTPSMDSSGGPLLLSRVTPTFNIKRPLSPDEIRSVALRAFMLQSLAFENLQQWTDFIGESSFSAEDLPSNIIAFYMGVDNLSRDDIGTICDVWSPEDSLSEFQSNQPSGRNRTFRPLPSSHTTGWPAELSSITPAVIGGPLMDEPRGTLSTLGGSSTDINLAHYNDLLAGNYHIVSATGSNTIDISSEESSSAAGNHFEVDGLPASHNFVFRWNILDNDGYAHAMWSDIGQVQQYGNANDAYIGSRTRARFRERNITSVTVNCRVAISNARQFNQLFSLRINLTW